jgi:hypothetical protein
MEFSMVDSNDVEPGKRDSGERQQLVCKGALTLLCLGVFALVMWAGESRIERCAKESPAARETCLDNLKVLAPQAPAKEALRQRFWAGRNGEPTD